MSWTLDIRARSNARRSTPQSISWPAAVGAGGRSGAVVWGASWCWRAGERMCLGRGGAGRQHRLAEGDDAGFGDLVGL